eukprot:COSAG01_NODE_2344_length_7864_cov_3.341790_6_plen_540_part_00
MVDDGPGEGLGPALVRATVGDYDHDQLAGLGSLSLGDTLGSEVMDEMYDMPPSAETGVPPAKPELEPGHSAPDHSEPALLGPGGAKPEAEDRCQWMWEDARAIIPSGVGFFPSFPMMNKKLQRANPFRWTVGTPLAVAAKLEHETAKNPQKHSARKVLVKWLSPEQPERVLESPAAALAFMKPRTRQDCTSPKDLMDPLTDLLPTDGMQLHAVATRGDVAEGARLVEAVAPPGHLDLLAAVDVHGWIPLHCAASSGHEMMCALLLGHEATAQLEAADHDGETPLHRAAAAGHEAVCTLLAARGSDRRWVPWGGIYRGMTAAALAESKGHIALAQLLSPRLAVTTGRWWLLRQARRDSPALCEELAEHIAELAAEQSWRTMAELGAPAERAVVAAAGGGGGQWRSRADFPSNAEYGAYIQAELTRGVRLAAPLPPPPSPFPSECCCPRLAASAVVDCMLSLLGEVVPSCRGGTHTESRRCRRQVCGCGRCTKQRARSMQVTRGAFSRPTAAHRRARCSGISTGTATGCSGTTSRSSSPPR